jgi:L-2-hydroxycarboxylate dehydrogenase (NAD+)
MKIHFDILKELSRHVFLTLGVSAADSETVADVVATADLYGFKTHGVSRLRYYISRIKDGVQHTSTPFRVLSSKSTTAVVDGGNGMGQVVGYRSMLMAIEKALTYGLGCVSVKNSSHFGICSYYSLMAAKAHMIGIVFTNTRPAVAAFGGSRAVLGTNPYSIAIPSSTYPFVIDCSTSIIQRGDVEVWSREKHTVPEGVSSPFVSDASTLLEMLGRGEAALTTFGKHKGYGLSVAIEILCSALTNGDAMSEIRGHYEGYNNKPYNLGHLFLVIDPSHFIDIETFKRKVSSIRTELQESGDSVLVAGDLEFQNIGERMANIEISEPVYQEIVDIASEFDFCLEREL